MEVWSLFKNSDTEKARESHICIISVGFFGNACDLLCSIAVAHTDNSESNTIFMRNLFRVFLPPIVIEVPSSPVQEKTYIYQSCVVCT